MNIGYQMLGKVKHWSCMAGTLILFIFAPGILLLGFLVGQLGDVKFWNGSGTIFVFATCNISYLLVYQLANT